jgi:hypothetical protein
MRAIASYLFCGLGLASYRPVHRAVRKRKPEPLGREPTRWIHAYADAPGRAASAPGTQEFRFSEDTSSPNRIIDADLPQVIEELRPHLLVEQVAAARVEQPVSVRPVEESGNGSRPYVDAATATVSTFQEQAAMDERLDETQAPPHEAIDAHRVIAAPQHPHSKRYVLWRGELAEWARMLGHFRDELRRQNFSSEEAQRLCSVWLSDRLDEDSRLPLGSASVVDRSQSAQWPTNVGVRSVDAGVASSPGLRSP